MPPRTIAIGDVHGCDRALEALLMAIAPEPRDTLVILGDVVDRGPDSRRCIDILLNLQDHCQLVVIQGNHEEMLLSALSGGEWVRDWMHYGGRETLESYGGFDSIPEDHLEFMRNGLNLHVTETEIFVHAGIDPLLPLDRQPASALRWERFAPWQGAPPEGKRVVCGHTVQPGGVPYVIERWVCIDTGVYLDKGRLTALDVTNDLVYQSNQSDTLQLVEHLDEIAEMF